MAKVLQYKDLSKLGKTEVFRLELPHFFEDLVERGDSLKDILARVTYEAHDLLSEMYPLAVATKEEWLEYMKNAEIEAIQAAVTTLKALGTLSS